MKKNFITAGLFCSLLFCTACRSSHDTLTLSMLNGNWEIEEINGAAIVSRSETKPFLLFDTAKGQITGFTGCNRITGSFERDSKPGVINISNVGSTRKACPDMSTERNILHTLSLAHKYLQVNADKIALCNESNRPIMILKKTDEASQASTLSDEWTVTHIGQEAVSEQNEQEAFIGFNAKEQKVYGCTGCNRFHGAYQADENNASSVSFQNIGSTMMMCRFMDNEEKILQALNATRSFRYTKKDELTLLDEEGRTLLVLKRK